MAIIRVEKASSSFDGNCNACIPSEQRESRPTYEVDISPREGRGRGTSGMLFYFCREHLVQLARDFMLDPIFAEARRDAAVVSKRRARLQRNKEGTGS